MPQVEIWSSYSLIRVYLNDYATMSVVSYGLLVCIYALPM